MLLHHVVSDLKNDICWMVYMVETFLLLPTSVKIYESRDNICQVIEVSVSPVTHKPLNCNDKTALVDSLIESMNLINNLTEGSSVF